MPNCSTFKHAHGLTWVIDEPLQRASHALVVDGSVWLVDPVDAEDAVAQAAALGPVAGVLQLLERHNRDCAAVAARLGAPHLTLPSALPGTPLEVVPVMRRKRWGEVALWWEAERVLVVAEAVGTAPLFAVGDGSIGVHPKLRLTPPQVLARFAPDHLLVGHGSPGDGPFVAADLARALAHSRQDIPKLLLALPKTLGGG